jgi:hypothetical protein
MSRYSKYDHYLGKPRQIASHVYVDDKKPIQGGNLNSEAIMPRPSTEFTPTAFVSASETTNASMTGLGLDAIKRMSFNSKKPKKAKLTI